MYQHWIEEQSGSEFEPPYPIIVELSDVVFVNTLLRSKSNVSCPTQSQKSFTGSSAILKKRDK
jgi:hypothetical protein